MNSENKNNKPSFGNTIGKYSFYMVVGLIILATGAVMAKTLRNSSQLLEVLPYLLIGFGAGIFGQNAGTLGKLLSVRKNPDIAEEIAIEENDERNVLIRDKARSKAYHLMLFVYGALMLAFGLMKVDMVVVLTMVAAYLFVIAASCYYYAQLNKQM